MSETTEKLPTVIINFVDLDGKRQTTYFTKRGKWYTSIRPAPPGHYLVGDQIWLCTQTDQQCGTNFVFRLTLVTGFVCNYICFPDGTLLLAYFKEVLSNQLLTFSGEQVMSSGGRFTLNGRMYVCECVIGHNGIKYYNTKEIRKEVNTPVTILQDDEKAPVTIPQDDEKAPAVEKKDVTYVSDKGETFGYILAFKIYKTCICSIGLMLF